MKRELEASGKTVEAAILNGARELGVDRSLVTYEILEMPKKGFLGFGEIPARVRVCYEAGTESSALEFVKLLIEDMDLGAEASLSDLAGNAKLIRIDGGDAGVLIGHHGDTLDSLQYLVNLVVNKREEEEEGDPEESEEASEDNAETSGSKKHRYTRITVDIEDYRSKREETLRTLARRKAQQVLKYRKNITLEPMNPYERRIIHSEIQGIEGVTTFSIGSDNNRRIVISCEEGGNARTQNRNRRRRKPQNSEKPAANAEQSTEISDNAAAAEEAEN